MPTPPTTPAPSGPTPTDHNNQDPTHGAGGFLTPSPSSPTLSTTSSLSYRPLPTPLSQALRPGSRQETGLIQYLDHALLNISRKHVKKFLPGGYTTIADPAAELEKLVDVVWISSTPALQIQYLLTIANTINDYLASFPPDWPPIFQLLDKLDRCFLELVVGTPRGWKMNMTEKVRVKGIIERTRLHLVKLSEVGGDEERPPDPATASVKDIGEREERAEREWESADAVDDGVTTDGDVEMKDTDEGEQEEDWDLHLEIARAYSRTLEEIGDELGG